MSTETPVAVTPPTPENVAEMLTSGDNDYHDGNYWHPSIGSQGNVVHIGITAYDEGGEKLPEVHFRAVVVEGEEAPLVLEWPTELGLSWHDGGDLLALDSSGIIRLNPRGVDGWELSPDEALELAGQLAAMAALVARADNLEGVAYGDTEAAQAQTGGAQS